MHTIQNVNFNQFAQSLIEEYLNANGVLSFDIFQVEDSSDLLTHRLAAKEAFNREIDALNSSVLSSNSNFVPFKKASEFLLKSTVFSKTQFLGDLKSKSVDQSFRHAFLSPPYSLKINLEKYKDEIEFFKTFCEVVLGGPQTTAVIHAWNTDFSNFFDDGREWWGTFFLDC